MDAETMTRLIRIFADTRNEDLLTVIESELDKLYESYEPVRPLKIIQAGQMIVATNQKTGEESKFYNQSEAARGLGLSPKSICLCLQGTQNSTQGYTFKYEKEAV